MPELNLEKPVRRDAKSSPVTQAEKAAGEKPDMAPVERAEVAKEAARSEDA
ncbi:MAG: hypothetical protein JWM33_728 [Caulobacteraceae bacterium]|nr:hypothetical protein [Caulobacteraceae bacterium]